MFAADFWEWLSASPTLALLAGPSTLAYIDPNSGGVLFYLLTFALSAISGAALFFQRQIRLFVSRAKRRLRELFRRDQ